MQCPPYLLACSVEVIFYFNDGIKCKIKRIFLSTTENMAIVSFDELILQFTTLQYRIVIILLIF